MAVNGWRMARERRAWLGSSSLTRVALAGAVLVAVPGVAAAQSLPVGGSVAAGAVSGTSNGTTMTINQTSDRAVINWQSFDVGTGRQVVFRQPNAQSATLNRVTGGTTSTIAGSITANGAVYLVNPNGIAITSTGSVNAGGGFVASTLGIADADFMAGNLAFTGSGKSGRVSNAGTISVGAGGYAALLGGSVGNAGTITVPLGRVGLASGESVALDLTGDGFLRVAVPTTALTQGNQALIEMTGRIAASGGRVVLSAATVRDAVRNVINVPGSISADSATGNGGSIVLLGGDGGTVRASGTLSARATGASGDGGFVETSGATVDFTGLSVDTSAANGRTGTWLVDPVDLTVDAAAAATISANLATSNVTLQTTANGASGPGMVSNPGAGNIYVGSAIAWNSTNTLSLLAYSNISLAAAITAPAGGLVLTPGNGVSNAGIVTETDAMNVGVFNLTNGSWVQSSGTLPAFYAHDFRFAVGSATFLRVTGGTGTGGSPYLISDVYGLEGMASQPLLSSSFAVANDIDASGTKNWNASAGFTPIGTDAAPFTGSFDGRHHVISGLTINLPNASFVGLFGAAQSATIANVGLTGVSITGSQGFGALAGLVVGGTVSNVYADGTVTGGSISAIAGGLIGGTNTATISNVYADVAVTSGNEAGGLIGGMSGGSLTNAYATGAVTTSNGYAGGLIGYVGAGQIRYVYATGAVRGASLVGGLVGINGGTIDNAYATGLVIGGANTAGLIGDNVGSITNSYWDTYSTNQGFATGGGTAGNSLPVTSNPTQSNAANYAYNANAYGNLTLASGIGTTTPTGFAFLYGREAGVRPFLAFEVPTAALNGNDANGRVLIRNAHQLQLIDYDQTRNSGAFALANDIDLSETGRVVVGTPSSYSGMWDKTGFYGLGQNGFAGYFSGAGHVLSNLYINEADSGQGLFAAISSTGTVADLGVVDAQVSGVTAVGVITASNRGTIVRSYATGTVVASSAFGGGISGTMGAGGHIIDSYANVAVTSGAGGGGLVGYMTGGAINNAYALGAVTGSFTDVGGLVGTMNGGSITSSYATGRVGGGASSQGGLVGSLNPGASITASYWDSYSTGQSAAVIQPGGTLTNVSAVTSDPSQSAAATYAYRASAYGNLAAGTGVGTASPTGFVFMPGNSTRPFLAFEVPTVQIAATDGQERIEINNAHQLQLIGYSGQTLSGSYMLGRAIDLGETGAVRNGTAGSYAGMWSVAGFVPLGTDGAGNVSNGTSFVAINTIAASANAGFTGSFTGNGFSLSNLTINRSTVKNVGLFGVSSGSLANINIASGRVAGLNGVGGLVGLQFHGSITGSTASAAVLGNNLVGGLVGNQASGAAILNSSTGGANFVQGIYDIGGLVGYASGIIISSSSSMQVTGSNYVGGLVGYAYNATIQGSASGEVTGAIDGSGQTGSLIGVLDGGSARGTGTGQLNYGQRAPRQIGQIIHGGVYSAQ